MILLEDILKQELQEDILSRIDLSKDVEDNVVNNIIDNCILDKSRQIYIPINIKNKLKKDLFNSIRRLDILSVLLADNNITEIMINGYNNIFVEEKGMIHKLEDKFVDETKLLDVIQQIVGDCNRIVNEATPIVDGRLRDGSRVNVVLPPVALDGAIVTIRRFPEKAYTIDDLINIGSLSREIADFLKLLVVAGYNIFISGGTGSGKTTFLNALTNFIPQNERIITIEDSAELKINNISNLVRLEVRNSNVEGNNQVSIRDLIKSALRMRPNRIIVGEVRDGVALDMISAMNTGHDGSLSTGHANSSKDMLARLETMILMGVDMPVLAIRQQIASALDIIIHLGRLRDRSRRVLEISEVLEVRDNEIKINQLFQFVEEREEENRVIGYLKKEGELHNIRKLQYAGLYKI